jgi:hypothetical protein
MRGQAAREGNACAPTACTIHHAVMQYTKTNSFYYASLYRGLADFSFFFISRGPPANHRAEHYLSRLLET